ncbi:MAG: hypothetical protein KHX42_10405 [Prevotella sp.]|nr:hypothetical protein [Prevotella sp.]
MVCKRRLFGFQKVVFQGLKRRLLEREKSPPAAACPADGVGGGWHGGCKTVINEK